MMTRISSAMVGVEYYDVSVLKERGTPMYNFVPRAQYFRYNFDVSQDLVTTVNIGSTLLIMIVAEYQGYNAGRSAPVDVYVITSQQLILNHVGAALDGLRYTEPFFEV